MTNTYKQILEESFKGMNFYIAQDKYSLSESFGNVPNGHVYSVEIKSHGISVIKDSLYTEVPPTEQDIINLYKKVFFMAIGMGIDTCDRNLKEFKSKTGISR